MRTEEIKIFKFAELSEEAKQKAIEWGADLNVDHNWYEFTYEDAKEIGLKIDSFDLYRKDIDGDIITSPTDTAERIIKNHGEECDTYKLADQFLKDWAKLVGKYSDGTDTYKVAEGKEDNFDEEADDMEQEFTQQLLEEYLSILDREYEYLTSKEAIIEAIELNEYEFTEDGEIY